MHHLIRRLLCITALAVLLSACAPSGAALQTAIAETQSLSRIPTLSAPMETDGPATPAPSVLRTALPPQASPLPTVHLQPGAQPIKLIGQGNSVVDVEKWPGPALLHAVYTGDGSFVVSSYDAAGQQLDVLVNAMGAYEGAAGLDFAGGQHTARLDVRAAGPWVLEIRSAASARAFDLPVTINGKGDDVLILRGKPGAVAAIAAGKGSFTVRGYTAGGSMQPLFSETAPYRGEALLDPATWALVVHSAGQWSLQIAAQ